MAKHLGSRRQPRLLAVPRGFAWAVGALATGVVVTGAVIAQGMASQQPSDALVTASQHDGAARHDVLVGQRRADVSRQADRPRFSPYRIRPGSTLALKPKVAHARKVSALSPASSTFVVAQSNILGSQHTAGRGGYGPGTYRAAITSSLLTSRGADVGGMQEVQADQLRVVQSRMPAYSFWPGAALGPNGLRLQIYWRSDRFAMMDNGRVTYVFSGQHIPLPYVLLRDRSTGAEFWMITTHNSPGGMEGERDLSTGIEINLIHRLMATDKPVIITGDMNEHTEFFCRVAASTGMVAANGGSGVGGCHLPPPPLRVDWIMGGHGVSFSGYYQDGASRARASDHYYLFSHATVTSQWYAP